MEAGAVDGALGAVMEVGKERWEGIEEAIGKERVGWVMGAAGGGRVGSVLGRVKEAALSFKTDGTLYTSCITLRDPFRSHELLQDTHDAIKWQGTHLH